MISNTLKTETELKEFLKGKEKSILFVHDTKSVEQIALFREILDGEHCLIIPTSPEPLFILDKLKLPYRIPEDYYTFEEFCNHTKDLEPKIMNLTEEIDRALEKTYPEIQQSGLKLAFYHLYPFVRVCYPLADAYFKIKKIIQTEKPDKIGLFVEQNATKASTFRLISSGLEGWLLWQQKENLFQKVLDIYQFDLPVYSFTLRGSIRPVKDNFSKESWKNKIKKLVQGRPRLYYFLKILKRDKRLALLIFFHRFKLTPLLLLNNGYCWDECHRELVKRGYYIWGRVDDNLGNWYRDNNEVSQLSKNILGKLEQSSSFRKNFKEDDIDFYPLLKGKISLFLEKIVPASINAYQKTIQLIKKKRIKGVLFSVNPTAISKSIAYAAQKFGIPVIGWQHGDMNYEPSHSIVLNDLLTADLFLSWGKGANENRQEVANKLKLERKLKVVGSTVLDELMSLPVPDCPKILEKIGIKNIAQSIIVYATTMYYLSNVYNFSYPPWSDNYIYNTQKKIIERLAPLKGIKIIKLHPNLFYALPALDKYCRSFKQQNVWTVRNEVLATLLFSIADAIIIDIPSTTILQAIACKKPIFCLTRHLKFGEKAVELLKKRVVLSETPENLMEEVELFIESGKYKADLQNIEFLENFGTSPDCRAAEKAVAAVDELVKDFSSRSK